MAPLRRLLLLSIQPPGASGVQAIRYAKLLAHLRVLGWEVHVLGPDPALDSVHREPVQAAAGTCHYLRAVAWSRRWSVRRHRFPAGHPLRGIYGVLQAGCRLLERLRKADPQAALLGSMCQRAEALLRRQSFAAVAGVCPDFGVLEQAARCAARTGTPLIAIYHDPHGSRSLEGFKPADPQRQEAVLQAAVFAIFASPLTRQRYIEAGLVAADRSTWISDSHPVPPPVFSSRLSPPEVALPQPFRLLHLGNLGPWRPVEPLLAALQALAAADDFPPAEIDQFGYIYPEASRQVAASQALSARLHVHPACPYAESHRHASAASALLVVAGPRHPDNLPSKFFEYLGHRKPILVLSPPDGCLADILERYPVGLAADVTSAAAIEAALRQLVSRADAFEAAYATSGILEAYAAPAVAERWAQTFTRASIPERLFEENQ